MATNQQVAERFTLPISTRQPLLKSYNQTRSATFYIRPAHHEPTLTHFVPMAVAMSYATRIALLVHNTHADVFELWMNPVRYLDPLAAPLTDTNLTMKERRAVVEGFFASEKE